MSIKNRESDTASFLPPLWILTLLFGAFALWIAFKLKELLVLLVLGYFIAYAMEPLLVKLQKRGVSRSVGVGLVFGSLSALIALLAVTAVPTVVEEFGKLTTNLNEYIKIGREKLGPLIHQFDQYIPTSLKEGRDLNSIVQSVSELPNFISGDTLKGILGAIVGTLLQGYSLTLTLVNVALLPFIVYYIAVDLPHIHSFFLELAPLTKRPKVTSIFSEIDGYVSAFVRGQIVVCCILFVLYTIGLGLLGVDLWFLLAAISGFGNIVPYFGFIIGISLTSLLTLVTFADLTHLLYAWGIFGVVQFLEGTFITPKIIGNSVGLSPLIIILALFAGAQMFGLLGVFLAVPTAAALRVLVRHTYEWVLDR